MRRLLEARDEALFLIVVVLQMLPALGLLTAGLLVIFSAALWVGQSVGFFRVLAVETWGGGQAMVEHNGGERCW